MRCEVATLVSNGESWERFRRLSMVRFVAESQTGWNGSGGGVVRVSAPAPDVLLFEESGSWRQGGGKALRFTNVFRWTLVEDRLRLEHLRFGADHPVFLFEMAVDAEGVWREVSPHLCREDCYQATLRLEEDRVLVGWRVCGPKRNDAIDYVYA